MDGRGRIALPTVPPLLLIAALLVLSCGEPPARQRALLRSFHAAPPAAGCPGPEDGASAPGAEPRPVVRGDSRREALVTCDGAALTVALDERASGWTLDLSLALAAGDESTEGPGGSARASIELLRDGSPTVLLEAAVAPGSWSEHRVELPAGASGAELVLRSSGPAPVAWAGLYTAADDADGWEPERPSLILVSLDTVRADHLSLYGYERPTTPRLARLGEESLVFTRALSASTWTLPSTATLLTGLLPGQHGTVHRSKRLPPEVATVAERLSAAGYRTAALTDGGFAGYQWGFAQGFDRYDVTPGAAWKPREKDVARTFREAAEWVRRNRYRPFFLFLHTYEAHQPYLDREGFADPFLAPGERGSPDLAMGADPNQPAPTPEELRRMIALYDGEIARADHYLGGFLDALAGEGLADQVALVVTSDHGEEFLEHGDQEHAFGKVFDPNVHVPLVVKPVRTPDGREPEGGRRIDTPVSGIDVAPTLLDLAGLPHDDLPGRSLLDPAPRPVLVHGVPSFPNLTAERFRLDSAAPGPSLILDRPGAGAPARLLRYQPGREAVRPWRGGMGERTPVPRLAALLAWTGAGRLFARLPDDARWLAVPRGSRVRPRALWSGGGWVALGPPGQASRGALAPGGPGVALAPKGPAFLVFDLEPGRGRSGEPWGVSLARGEGADGARAPYRLRAERRPPWNPFADPLPPPGAVLPTSLLLSAEAGELDEATRKELKALGYVR